ncbi:hypothetical protein TURU_027373 [Turdus rufiventris]|nr:hypothetical protein TURU_027373 [Turdus rufiventris]
MLCLLGVMLSVLCLVSPAPHTRATPCPDDALFKETIQDLRNLNPENNMMENGENVALYLEGFIEALKNSKENVKEIVRKLKKIQSYGESCTGWMKSSSNDESCSKAETDFSKFKESLQEFLKWVNEKLDCKSVGKSNLGLYMNGKCRCHDPWKSHRGLG